MLVWREEIGAGPGDWWSAMQGRDSTATAGETAAGTTLRHPPVTHSDCCPVTRQVHYILLSRTGHRFTNAETFFSVEISAAVRALLSHKDCDQN